MHFSRFVGFSFSLNSKTPPKTSPNTHLKQENPLADDMAFWALGLEQKGVLALVGTPKESILTKQKQPPDHKRP